MAPMDHNIANDHNGTKKISVIGDGQNLFCQTFVIDDEDYTLGNALTHILNQHPDIEIAGHTVPHPNQRKLHIRIQSVRTPALQIFRQGLIRLRDLNKHMLAEIKKEVEQYKE